MNIEWETPQEFFDELDREFDFSLDPCATPENAKCKKFFTKKIDGLKQSWYNENIWLNPPYDRSIPLWIQKAYEVSQHGDLVVCLIQGRSTDTKMWHDYVMKASEIRFVRDRLHFGKNGNHQRANISSIVVVFRPFCKGPPKVMSIDTTGKSNAIQ